MNKLSVWLTASLFPIALAMAAEPSADQSTQINETQPDATVQLSGGAVAAGIGFVWGNGKVNYENVDHSFSISGVSIVDAGAASITASGTVYHLSKLSDFEGNYVAWSAGLTIAGGGSATYLKNEHGVVMKLASTTQGLRFNLSTNGVKVKFKE